MIYSRSKTILFPSHCKHVQLDISEILCVSSIFSIKLIFIYSFTKFAQYIDSYDALLEALALLTLQCYLSSSTEFVQYIGNLLRCLDVLALLTI